MTYLVLFDTETTGLDPNTCDICQFASVVHKEGTPVTNISSFSELCKPSVPITPASTKIHGITAEMVENKLSAQALVKEWWGEILEIAEEEEIILGGHNTQFDWQFIKKYIYIPASVKSLCTMRMARRFAPSASSYKLESLYRDHYKLSSYKTLKAHDALCDVWMSFDLLQYWMGERNLVSYSQMASDFILPVQLEVMPFGKYKGQLFIDLPDHYLLWLTKQGESMDIDVKYTAQVLLNAA